MRNAVKYKDTWLMKNSKAYEYWERGELSLLDSHLKQLDKDEKELLKRYEAKSPVPN